MFIRDIQSHMKPTVASLRISALSPGVNAVTESSPVASTFPMADAPRDGAHGAVISKATQ